MIFRKNNRIYRQDQKINVRFSGILNDLPMICKKTHKGKQFFLTANVDREYSY